MIPGNERRVFHERLQGWFAVSGRVLPWRSNPHPYAVLVSEFMLQQTTVAAVVPFFERWMARFPDVHKLAAAPEADVLKLWEGLGYYSRARNLHRAAQAVCTRHHGVVPADAADLWALPGVGPYTAAAIAAFAFDQCVPVLDANINRVVARLFNYKNDITTAAGKSFLESSAAALLPESGGRNHTSALMDLGSMVCRAGAPDCPNCPVRSLCRADAPASIPVKRPRPEVEEAMDIRALSVVEGRIALVRSNGPRWKGLWTLPPGPVDGECILTARYTITRYRVTLRIIRCAPQPGWKFFALDDLPAMPSPHRQALEDMQNLPLAYPELF